MASPIQFAILKGSDKTLKWLLEKFDPQNEKLKQLLPGSSNVARSPFAYALQTRQAKLLDLPKSFLYFSMDNLYFRRDFLWRYMFHLLIGVKHYYLLLV